MTTLDHMVEADAQLISDALRLRFSPDMPLHGRQRFHNVLGLPRSH